MILLGVLIIIMVISCEVIAWTISGSIKEANRRFEDLNREMDLMTEDELNRDRWGE